VPYIKRKRLGILELMVQKAMVMVGPNMLTQKTQILKQIVEVPTMEGPKRRIN